MNVLSFRRSVAPPWDRTTGHAIWSLHEGFEFVAGCDLLALGWGDEWEVEMFLHAHAEALARAMGFEPTGGVQRAALGARDVDLRIPVHPSGHLAVEVKGPGINKDELPGAQVASYAAADVAAGREVRAVAVAVGLDRMASVSQRERYKPSRWWSAASTSLPSFTALCVRVAPDHICIVTFSNVAEADAFLAGRTIQSPDLDRVKAWKRAIRDDRRAALGDDEARSLKVSLGKTAGATATRNRWEVRLFEEHVWLTCWYSPLAAVAEALADAGAITLEKGAAANYESRRLVLGPVGEAPQAPADVLPWVYSKLPSTLRAIVQEAN